MSEHERTGRPSGRSDQSNRPRTTHRDAFQQSVIVILSRLTPLAFALAAMSAQAATRVDLHTLERRPGQPPVRRRQRQPRRAAQPRRSTPKCSAWTPTRRCTRSAHQHDSDGTRHYRYQQTFRGVPVFGEHVIVSEDKAGNVRNMFGRTVDGLAGELPAPRRSSRRAQGAVDRQGAPHWAATPARCALSAKRPPDDLRRRRQPRAHGVRRVVLRRQRQAAARRPVRS